MARWSRKMFLKNCLSREGVGEDCGGAGDALAGGPLALLLLLWANTLAMLT
jgi:hypothetical protein